MVLLYTQLHTIDAGEEIRDGPSVIAIMRSKFHYGGKQLTFRTNTNEGIFGAANTPIHKDDRM